MTQIDEIASDVFRICTFAEPFNLQFCQFLVRDEEPLLVHTGMNQIFPDVRDAVASLIDLESLRWIGFSHFESDECGSLFKWQEVAPQSTAVCSFVGKMVSVDDVVARRPARALSDGETFSTGKREFRFVGTPHVPHGWDAGLLFEETESILFASDLFHQNGDVEAVTDGDVIGRTREVHESYLGTPFADYLPYTEKTGAILTRLASLNPEKIVPMHGSTYTGNGTKALMDLDVMLKDVYVEAD